MRRVALGLGVLMAASVAVVPTVATQAHADVNLCDPAYDNTPPTYSNLTVAPTQIVLGRTSKKTLTVTLKAADTCGIGTIDVAFLPVSEPSAYGIVIFPFKRIAGTDTNGTFRATQVLDRYLQPGVWKMATIRVRDVNANGNYTTSNASFQIRRLTAVSAHASKKSVKKNKSFTLYGTVRIWNTIGRITLYVESHAKGKPWKRLKTVVSERNGSYSTKIKPSKTTYYRVVHPQNATSTLAVSQTVRVSRK